MSSKRACAISFRACPQTLASSGSARTQRRNSVGVGIPGVRQTVLSGSPADTRSRMVSTCRARTSTFEGRPILGASGSRSLPGIRMRLLVTVNRIPLVVDQTIALPGWGVGEGVLALVREALVVGGLPGIGEVVVRGGLGGLRVAGLHSPIEAPHIVILRFGRRGQVVRDLVPEDPLLELPFLLGRKGCRVGAGLRPGSVPGD